MREHDETYEHYAMDTRELKRRWELKEEECKAMAKQVEEIKESYEGRIQDIIAQKNDEIDDFKNKLFVAEKDHKKIIDKMNAELTHLREFTKREREYQDALKKLNSDLEKTRAERNEMVSKMHVERAKAIALEHEREREHSNKRKPSTKSDLDKSIERARTPVSMPRTPKEKENDDGYNIFERTAVGHKRESTMTSQKLELEKSFNLPHINISADEEELLGYQSLNIRQGNKIKALKNKYNKLKELLDDIQLKHQKDIERVQYTLTVKIKTLEAELEKCKEEVKNQKKENKNLKALAQMILDQRSEIESFLVDAINLVKQNAKRDMMNETRKGKLPDIPSRPATTFTGKRHPSGKLTEKTEIGELDWEEKEKILRILFSKINNSMNAKKWQESMVTPEMMALATNGEK